MKTPFRKTSVLFVLCLAFLAICVTGAMAAGKIKSLKITTPANTVLKVGEPLQLEVQIKPADASDPTISWSSSNPNVAEVDENGVVTAKTAGKVKITATAQDGSKKKATVSLTVPSLYCDTKEILLDQPEGASFTVDYYGKDWDKDVTVSVTGKAFDYAAERDGTRITFRLSAAAEGKGKLTIKDKKDPKGAVTVSVTARAGAFGTGNLVTLKDVRIRKNGSIDLTFQNNGSVRVSYIGVEMIPRNKKGDILYTFDATTEGVRQEIIYGYISAFIEPGESHTVTIQKHASFPKANQVDVAICRIDLWDDTVIAFSEDHLRWFSSSKNKYITNPEGSNINSWPGNETEQKGKTVKLALGIREFGDLTSWQAKRAGFSRGGWLVTDMESGSAAAQAGLQKGDLITAVNGISFTENMYALLSEAAAMAEDGSLTLTVERLGQKEPFEAVLARAAQQPESAPSSGETGGASVQQTQTAETVTDSGERKTIYYDDGGDSRYASPYEDTGIGKMSFETPDGCSMISRDMVNDITGKVLQKELSFNKYGKPGWKLSVEYIAGKSLSGYNLSLREGETDLGAWEAGGASFGMVKKNGMIVGYAQYGGDVYRVSFIYDQESDEEVLKTFIASCSFGGSMIGVENNLLMGNLVYTKPESGYDSVFSVVRVKSDGSLEYMRVRYDLPAPDVADMIFFPTREVRRVAGDDAAETTVNGFPALCRQTGQNDTYYFGRPEGVYEVDLQVIESVYAPDEYKRMKTFCRTLLESVTFK